MDAFIIFAIVFKKPIIQSIMKKSDFNKEREIVVNVEGEEFEFSSYVDMLGNFNDVKNHDTWAVTHKTSVFVAHGFDTIGKIVDRFETEEEAEAYAEQLNEYYAICEEYNVEEK